MTPSGTLREALGNLRAERDHRAAYATTAFQAQIKDLRRWQSHHVETYHRAHARRQGGEALLEFLTRSFYLNADWEELTAHPDATARRITRIVRDDRALVIATRLQTLSDRLDAALADALLAQTATGPITPRRYVAAFRAVGQAQQREQQTVWINDLITLLGGYADNRAAYWAFKFAGAPAHALRMGRTYALLAKGFEAMRATPDVERVTRDAVAAQRARLHRLLGH